MNIIQQTIITFNKMDSLDHYHKERHRQEMEVTFRKQPYEIMTTMSENKAKFPFYNNCIKLYTKYLENPYQTNPNTCFAIFEYNLRTLIDQTTPIKIPALLTLLIETTQVLNFLNHLINLEHQTTIKLGTTETIYNHYKDWNQNKPILSRSKLSNLLIKAGLQTKSGSFTNKPNQEWKDLILIEDSETFLDSLKPLLPKPKSSIRMGK